MTTKRKVGRPRVLKSQERLPLVVLLSKPQRKACDAAAATLGIPTSTWMRMTCLAAADPAKPPTIVPLEAGVLGDDHYVHVKLTKAERKLLDAAAKVADLGTSTWIRIVSVNAAMKS